MAQTPLPINLETLPDGLMPLLLLMRNFNFLQQEIDAINAQLGTIQIVTLAGPVVVRPLDRLVVLNKAIASATAVALGTVAARPYLDLTIVDWAGTAGPITLTPFGAEKIMGLPQAVLLSGPAGVGSAATITLGPVVDLDGWVEK